MLLVFYECSCVQKSHSHTAVALAHRYDGRQRLDAACAERDVGNEGLFESSILKDAVGVIPDLQTQRSFTDDCRDQTCGILMCVYKPTALSPQS